MALAAQAPEPDLVPRYRDSFWLQAVWDMAYHLMSNWLWWLYPGYKSHQVHHNALIYLGTGLHMLRSRRTGPRVDALVRRLREAGTTYYVLPLQMENDFQLRAYSPFFDLKTPIHAVIRSFAEHAPAESRLLVKIHPLDPGIRNWSRIVRRSAEKWGVTDRVDFADGGDLGKMLDGCRGVVTVNSTVGLWSMRANKPTMTLGAAIYDITGLTYQGALETFWTQAEPPRRDLWDAFIKAIVANIQIRGVYYKGEGMAAAVEATASRLDLTQGAWLETRSRARSAPEAGDDLPGIEALQNA